MRTPEEPPFVLGEVVTISRVLVKTKERRPNPELKINELWRVWRPASLRTVMGSAETTIGIVIGTRTLMNVERIRLGYEEGWDNNLSTAERFQAVWVAYDIRRKPVFVLPEDAHRVIERNIT